MDAAAVKATQLKQWTGAAAGWGKHDAELQSHLAPVTLRMVAPLQPGQQVLDLCSGTGEPALSAAQRVQPGGHVTGIDFVEDMLAVARDKAAQRRIHNVEFRQMDAEALAFPEAAFDAATFRFGLMFMPDPLGCLKSLKRVLKPGALLSLTCWAEPVRNPWASIPGMLVRKYVDLPDPEPGAPGPFAFADPVRLRRIVADAGFAQIQVEPLEVVMADAPTGAEFVAFTRDVSPGLRTTMDRLPADKQSALAGEIAQEVERAGGGRAYLKGLTWFATARN